MRKEFDSEKAFRESNKREALGLIVAPRERNEKDKNGANKIRKFLDSNITTFEKYFLFVPSGTYEKVIRKSRARNNWWPRWDGLEGYCLQPGKAGGLVKMASRIEKKLKDNQEIKGPITVLVLLASPKDLEESYPEVRALIRCAIRNNIIFLTNYRSLELWIQFEGDSKRQNTYANDTVALVAHDEMKLAMCRWVVQHR